MKYTIASLSFFLLIFGSCSKFEDGPCISFRSEGKRLEGDWLLKYWTVDGIDSLQYWNNYFGNECKFSFYPYDGDDNKSSIDWGNSLIYYRVDGKWGIDDIYLTGISFVENQNSNALPLWFMLYPQPRNGLVEWTIDKLKYNDVWFEMEVSNKRYELHLERIK